MVLKLIRNNCKNRKRPSGAVPACIVCLPSYKLTAMEQLSPCSLKKRHRSRSAFHLHCSLLHLQTSFCKSSTAKGNTYDLGGTNSFLLKDLRKLKEHQHCTFVLITGPSWEQKATILPDLVPVDSVFVSTQHFICFHPYFHVSIALEVH